MVGATRRLIAWPRLECVVVTAYALFVCLAPSVAASEEAEQVARPFEWVPPGHVAPLTFGMLLTVDTAVGPDEVTRLDSGFDVSDARVSVAGALDKGFGYFLQANLINSRPLLDLIVDWKHGDSNHDFGISGGYFRTPFSGELLIAAPYLDFINRSQIVTALAPSRQVGVQLDQEIFDQKLVARVGVFNGNGFDPNDDDRLLYVARVDGALPIGDRDGLGKLEGASRISYGINFAYSEDESASLGLSLPNPFKGTRKLAGADMRWSTDTLFVSAEGIYGSIDPDGLSRRDVFGYQASIGWKITKEIQVLARYDALWAGSLASDLDLAIASAVYAFNQYVSIQAEIRVPTRGAQATPGGAANITLQF
jgi:hypothetical protein